MSRYRIILFAFLSVLLLITTQATTAQDETTFAGIDIVFISDQSGSMGGRNVGCVNCDYANDEQGLRFYAPEYAIEWLGLDLLHVHKGSDVQVALVNFGSLEPNIGLPPTRIQAATEEEWNVEWASISQQLGANRERWSQANLHGTDHKAAFNEVVDLFREMENRVSSDEPRLKAIVLLTDGGPCPNECVGHGWSVAQQATYLRELEERFRSGNSPFPKDVYRMLVIAMNDPLEDYWEDTANIWSDIADGNAYKVNERSEIGARFSEFILPLTELLTPDPDLVVAPIDEEIQPGFYDVRPYLQQITFTIFKGDSADQILIEENGERLDTEQSSERIRVNAPNVPIRNITIFDPEPGRWRIQVSEGAIVKIRVRGLFFQPNLEQSFQSVHLSYPVPVQLSLVDGSGNFPPTYDDPKYDLNVEALVTPGNEIITLDKASDGRYAGEWITRRTGRHTVQLHVTTANPDGSTLTLLDESLPDSFDVWPIDAVFEPADGLFHEGYSAEFGLHLVGRNGERIAPPPGTSWDVSAQVGDAHEPVELRRDADRVYQGQFTPTDDGDYTIHTIVTGRDSFDQPFTLLEKAIGSYSVLPTTPLDFTIEQPVAGFSHIIRNEWRDPFPYEIGVRLHTADGTPIDPAGIGSDNSKPFQAALVNPIGLTHPLTLTATNETGLYVAESSQLLPPGAWSLVVTPTLNLSRDYLMEQVPQTRAFTLLENPRIEQFNRTWPIVTAAIATLILLLILRRLLLARNPMKGLLQVVDQYETPLANWNLGGLRRNRVRLRKRKIPPTTFLRRLDIRRPSGSEGVVITATLRDGMQPITAQTMMDGSRHQLGQHDLYLIYKDFSVS